MNQLNHIIALNPELEAIKDELHDAWYKRQIFRTDTEARFAVLNDFKFPTNASKYWQAVREQTVHFDELVTLTFSLRRKKIDLQEVEEKLKSAIGFDKDRLLVDKDELLFYIASGEQVAKDRVREIMQWSKIKKEVNTGDFDDKNVNTHQKESLFKSVYNRAAVAPADISAEERLSLQGILHALKDDPVNREFIAKLKG